MNYPCSQDGEPWFSTEVDVLRSAAAQCYSCPIQADCLAGAIERGEEHGVWGGRHFGSKKIGRPRLNPLATKPCEVCATAFSRNLSGESYAQFEIRRTCSRKCGRALRDQGRAA